MSAILLGSLQYARKAVSDVPSAYPYL